MKMLTYGKHSLVSDEGIKEVSKVFRDSHDAVIKTIKSNQEGTVSERKDLASKMLGTWVETEVSNRALMFFLFKSMIIDKHSANTLRRKNQQGFFFSKNFRFSGSLKEYVIVTSVS